MDEGERDYRDQDIPLGRGFMGERPFDDRPLPGHERFREPWNAREVRTDIIHMFFNSYDL